MGNDSIRSIEVFRHSCSHVMAYAMQELFGDVKFAYGPAVENGFYYDFGLPNSLLDENLVEIENKMKEIIARKLDFVRKEVSVEEAKKIFADQPYKLQTIEKLDNASELLSVYYLGDYVDLCRGPHVSNTSEIPVDCFKIDRTSGAYWLGDAKNEMLQRVYGIAFFTKAELDDYLAFVEEAKKRDHRVLGQQMDLYSLSSEIGLGLPLFHPKGGMIRYLMQSFSQKAHILNDYKWVYTPHIGRGQLWETSGHLQFYKDSMYNPIDVDGENYYIKPMSCPFHILIYKDSPKSYRDLPIRYAEYAAVYRYELSGTLQGLTRVRAFTQDDAHIICTKDQIMDEVVRALKFSLYILKAFGIEDYTAYIATKPEKKFIGEDEQWQEAIASLKTAVEACGLHYEMDEGGGAFYGPKIDLKIKDSLGREWQCSTIQFDFNLPERFDVTYVGEDGQKHVPYMVHRALFGSIERFFAMLIEHYAGNFPLWLSPTQVEVIPINNKKHIDYAQKVVKELKRREIRAELDDSGSPLSAKIQRSTVEKIPFMFIVGNKEAEAGTIAVRTRSGEDLGTMTLEQWFDLVQPQLDMGIPKYVVED